MEALRVEPFGDAAVIVELDGPPGPATSRLVRTLIEHLGRDGTPPPGWSAPVAGATGLLIHVDPVLPGSASAAAAVRERLAGWSAPAAAGPPLETASEILVPVRYGGPWGPDLAEVAARTGLPPAEVVRLHAGTRYTAAFVGFAPGFAYLEPLPEPLRLPRLDVPRPRLAAGSVAIAGPYTAVYPGVSPGGWWIIGQTDLRVWDPGRRPPARLRTGTVVRFVPT